MFISSAVKHEAEICLQVGITSPYNCVEEYQRYISSLAYQENSAPTTRVNEDHTLITYKEYTLDIHKWREGLQVLANEIDQEIEELIYGEDYGLSSLPDIMIDDWTNEESGYSWMKNSAPLPFKRCLVQRMLKDKNLNLGPVDGSGRILLNYGAMSDCLQKAASINEKLGLLIWQSAGAGARVSQFTDHKIVNALRARTVFRSEKHYWFVTRRSKSETIINKEVFVPVKLHPRLCKMLDKYLLIIRPMEIDFATMRYGNEEGKLYQQYLFVRNGCKVTDVHFRENVKTFMRKYCGVEVGPGPFRNLMVEVTRRYIGSENEMWEEELDVLASARGHSLSTNREHYATEEGHLPCMSSDLLLRYDRGSEAWWEVTGFKPRCPPLLPLKQRRQLKDQIAGSLNEASDYQTNQTLNHSFDPSSLLASLTSTITSELQKIKSTIRTEVQSAVAESMTELVRKGVFSASKPSDFFSQNYSPPQHIANEENLDNQDHFDNDGDDDMYVNVNEHLVSQNYPSQANIADQENLDNYDNDDVSYDGEIFKGDNDGDDSDEEEGIDDDDSDSDDSDDDSDDYDGFSRGNNCSGDHDGDGDGPSPGDDGPGPGDDGGDNDPEDYNECHESQESQEKGNFDLDMEIDYDADEIQSEKTKDNDNFEQHLNDLLKKNFPNIPQPNFKSNEQKNIAALSVMREHNFVGILATGGGKSIAYTLPYFHEPNNITFVAVPNKFLLRNQLERTKSIGIPCCQWDATTKIDLNGMSVVFVAWETLVSAGFQE